MPETPNISYEEYLEGCVTDLLAELEFQKTLLASFWSGDVPDNATLDHLVLAKAGRHRLEEKAKRCALLER